MRRIISLLMENEAGALSRVVGLFAQRGYNIESLTVAATEDASLSRLTLTTFGDDHKIEQITKNLNKLIDVVKLVDLSEGAHIEREHAAQRLLEGNRLRAQGLLADHLAPAALRLVAVEHFEELALLQGATSRGSSSS